MKLRVIKHMRGVDDGRMNVVLFEVVACLKYV